MAVLTANSDVLAGRSLAAFCVLLFWVAHAFSRLSRLFVAVERSEVEM
jgi:hypothetical protein